MKRFACLLTAVMFPLTAQAQFTVTFDGSDQLATHGFTSTSLYPNDVAGIISPFVAWANAPVSGTGVIYNFNAANFPATIQRVGGGAFTFTSGYFTSLLAVSEGMYFRGYTSLASYQASRDFVTNRRPDLNDGAYYNFTEIDAAGPSFVALNWQNLVVLEMGSTGGLALDPTGTSSDNFEGFAADDFAMSFAPEPSSLTLLVSGLLCVLAVTRSYRRIRV